MYGSLGPVIHAEVKNRIGFSIVLPFLSIECLNTCIHIFQHQWCLHSYAGY